MQNDRSNLRRFPVGFQIVIDQQVNNESALFNSVQVNVELSILGFDDNTNNVSIQITRTLVQLIECQEHIQHFAQQREREELVQVLISVRDLVLRSQGETGETHKQIAHLEHMEGVLVRGQARKLN